MNADVTVAAYDRIAAWYDDWVRSQPIDEDPFFQEVEALMGDVAGQTVCDLACGQGRVARRLADLGAHVLGLDISSRLLAIARQAEANDPRGITYLLANSRFCEGIADGTFDGVVCHMALMDIADLAPTVVSVARILKPTGWFIFSILHPCYNTPQSGEMLSPEGWIRTISGYFGEGYWKSDTRPGPPGKVGAYHRTLGTYINALSDAGFTLERVNEPRLVGSHAERRPIWNEVPAALVGRCRK
jgi:ubiquinone/menaquinone biosynthesis C-methylase UbiE